MSLYPIASAPLKARLPLLGEGDRRGRAVGRPRIMPDAMILDAQRPAHILTAARMLREGAVVVVPTDTLYGLAASVFRDRAVERVYTLKARRPEMRVPVLLGTAADLAVLAEPPPRVAWNLIGAFWPGALTLVLPASASAPRSITRNMGTVALRVPANTACLELLQVLGEPIVGTSANRSGRPPTTTARGVLEQIPDVDAILADDAGVTGGAPSTILEVTDRSVRVLRAGAVSIDRVRQVVGAATPVEEPGAEGPDRG